MIPRSITAEHVLEAMARIDVEGVPTNRRSTRYLLRHEGKDYPPKLVVSLAAELATGEPLASGQFNGGKETNKFLSSRGFKTIPRPPGEQPTWPARARGIASVALRDTASPPPSQRAPAEHRSSVKHNERCSDCKNTIYDLLRRIYGSFGTVKVEHRLPLPLRPELVAAGPHGQHLKQVFDAICEFRGHRDFVRSKATRPCDVFVMDPGFMVELDESQHFSLARAASLRALPESWDLGFQRDQWISLCETLQAHDPVPTYRDEQRAWYDLVRDVAHLHGHTALPTVRIYMGEREWCSLDPTHDDDLARFFDWVPHLPTPADAAHPDRVAPVSLPAASPMGPPPPTRGDQMNATTKVEQRGMLRIARVVLDLCAPKAELEGLGAGTDRPAWHGFFKATHQQFLDSPDAWAERLGAVATKAGEAGADILALPACAVMVDDTTVLADWAQRFSGVPHVIAGAYDPRRGEFIAHFAHGELMEVIPAYPPRLLQLGSVQAMVAISSTVRCVYERDFDASSVNPPEAEKPLVVLDLGHNQYGGRYGKTLRKVNRVLSGGLAVPSTFVLGYWHYTGGQRSYPWVEPKDAAWITVEEERHRNSRLGADDWLDLIDVDLTAAQTEFQRPALPASWRTGLRHGKASQPLPGRMVLQNVVLKLKNGPPLELPLKREPWLFKWECLVLETSHPTAGDLAVDVFFGTESPGVMARLQVRGKRRRDQRIAWTAQLAEAVASGLSAALGPCHVDHDGEGKPRYKFPREVACESGEWDVDEMTYCATVIARVFGRAMAAMG